MSVSYVDFNCLTVRLALVGFHHVKLMWKSYIDFNCLTVCVALVGLTHVVNCTKDWNHTFFKSELLILESSGSRRTKMF